MRFTYGARTEKNCIALEFPLMRWNTARNRILREGKRQEVHHTICISDGCLEEIAEYESKERCLEVLDEIQRVCAQYLTWSGGAALMRGNIDIQPGAVAIPRVYEMPEK